ncbi:hypothetical protein VB715_15200 [Crocosphaera sp. UHCC 0190]|uniref:hypothetical protein n=1 Tax=Crocosphaera sp. UHCC 0190 TaxID=3110246 RepID=UPI002B1ED807|nr:hypothetical protein [Crocosphaera sp. UHCC 0190]MEA5511120.1 hypothetical protein [Crocosphaera sp. UHCC 0190]
MNNIMGFILKILMISLGFSLIIKYLAPLIPVVPNHINATIFVMVLPLSMTLLLVWRIKEKSSHL